MSVVARLPRREVLYRVPRIHLFGSLEIHDAPRGDRIAAQPKLALLLGFLLVARPRGFQSRDRLLGMFWPEHSEERARGALRTALHALRDGLGPDLIVRRGDNDIAIDAARIWCDVHAFDDAATTSHYARAIELHRGALLEGQFGESPALEDWLTAERARYQEAASDAAWALAESYQTGPDLTQAARWARKAAKLAGHDERRIRKIMMLLDGSGDRVGAIAVYEEFARYVARELDVQPSEETTALAARIRSRPV
jgi:DNA-binding SARP family transcriptional activator